MSNEIHVTINQKLPKKCDGCIFWTKSKDTGNCYCGNIKSPFYLRTCEFGCILKETEADENV